MEDIFNEIARDIKGHANDAAAKASSLNGLEFGAITSSGLKLDNFKYEIKDYMVLEHLKLGGTFSSTTDGLHSVSTPNQLRPLGVGDRVLVATVSSEFIVIGRI